MSSVLFFKTKVPFISLSNERINKILNQTELEKSKLLYDLGYGDERFLIKTYERYEV